MATLPLFRLSPILLASFFCFIGQIAPAAASGTQISTLAMLQFFRAYRLQHLPPRTLGSNLQLLLKPKSPTKRQFSPPKLPLALESMLLEKYVASKVRVPASADTSIRPISEDQSHGLFANRKFRKGEMIAFYAGRPIDPSGMTKEWFYTSLEDDSPKQLVKIGTHDDANTWFVGSLVSYREFLKLTGIAFSPTEALPHLLIPVMAVETLKPVASDQQFLVDPEKAYWKVYDQDPEL